MVNQRQLNGGEQGEGSGLDADTVDLKESRDLGNNIDGKSITKNQNNELKVSTDNKSIALNSNNNLQSYFVHESVEIIGDFENDLKGSWNTESYGFVTSDSGGAEGGNYCMRVAGDRQTDRSVDFTDKGVVEVHIIDDPLNVGDTGSACEVVVGGTSKKQVSPSSSSEFVSFEVNVSDETGTQTLALKNPNSAGTSVGVDRIKVKSKTVEKSISSNGEGGLT